MASERISSIIDIGAVEKEQKQLLTLLKQIQGTMDGIGKIKLDLKNSDSLGATRKAAKEAEDGINGLVKQYEELEKVQKKVADLQAREAKATIEAKEQYRRKTAEIKNTIREQNAAAGSIEQMRAQLIRLNKEYDNLSKAQREAAGGMKLKEQIAGVSGELKKLEGDTGRFQRNVGNYANAFGEAFGVVNRELQKIRNDINSGNIGGQALTDLKDREQVLLQVTQQLSKEFGSTKQQSKAFQEAAAQLGVAMGHNSEVFQQFKKQVGEGVDTLNDIRDSIKLAASDTGQLDKLIGASQAMVGGFSVAQGAVALLGDENEDLQKTFVKLQAAMTILNGLQAIQNELKNKDGILRKGLLVLTSLEYRQQIMTAAAQKVAIVQTTLQGAAESKNIAIRYAAIVAQKALNAVMALTPTGMLTLALVALAGALMSATTATDKAAESLEQYNREMEDSARISEIFVDAIGKAGRKRLAELEAAGASQAELRKATEDLMRAQIQEKDNWVKANEAKKEAAMTFLEAVARGRKEGSEEEIKAAQGVVATWDKAYMELGDMSDELYITEKKNTTANYQEWSDAEDKRIEDQKRANEKNKKLSEERAKQRKEIEERNRKAAQEIIMSQMQFEAEAMKSIADNEELSLQQRTSFLEQYVKKQSQIILTQRDFELQNDKLTEKEREKIKHDAALNLLNLQREIEGQVTAMIKAETEKRKQLAQEETDNRLAAVEGKIATRSLRNQTLLNNQLHALNIQYQNGEISSLEEFEAQKAKIIAAAKDKAIEEEIMGLRELMDAEGVTAEKRAEYENKISELKLKKSDEVTGKLIEDADTVERREKELAEKKKELLMEVAELAFQLLSSSVEEKKNAVQAEMDAAEVKRAKEIELIEQSTLSEQDKAAKITQINAKADAEKIRQEQKMRELDIKKARFDRIKSIFNIGLSTAEAIMAAVATYKGTPMSFAMPALIGAIGAVQIASVLAQPIPKFAVGTTNSPEGPAIVGEKGSELRVEPDGSMSMTPGVPTLTWLKKGTKIVPHDEVNEVLRREMMRDTVMNLGWKADNTEGAIVEMKERLDWQMERLIKSVREGGQREPSRTSFPGWMEYLRKNIYE